jgi:hypothetical protein
MHQLLILKEKSRSIVHVPCHPLLPSHDKVQSGNLATSQPRNPTRIILCTNAAAHEPHAAQIIFLLLVLTFLRLNTITAINSHLYL